MRQVLWQVLITAAIAAVLALFAPCAQAGPPLICWPFDIGSAASLPWGGSGWHDSSPSYDLKNLAGDTLALLGPDTPVLVRMETLRRASIYAGKDSTAASELYARIAARAAAISAGKPDALALFDLAYLTEAYKQSGIARAAVAGAAEPDGYALVTRAIALRGGDATMELAAALIASSSPAQRSAGRLHFEKAAAAASENSLLARNLVSHSHLLGIQASNFNELRAQLVASKN